MNTSPGSSRQGRCCQGRCCQGRRRHCQCRRRSAVVITAAALAVSLSWWPAGVGRAEPFPAWAVGPFVRPAGVNPLLPAQMSPVVPSPAAAAAGGKPAEWEAGTVSDPAAVVRGGKVCVLYTARPWQDGKAGGPQTGSIGLAESGDGLRFNRLPAPVLSPDAGEAGCHSPQVVELPDGAYLLTYTLTSARGAQADQGKPPAQGESNKPADAASPAPAAPPESALAVATSRDLVHWDKHGYAFAGVADPRVRNAASHAGALVCHLREGRLVASQIEGKYWMYWSDGAAIRLATSPDALAWTPLTGPAGELVTALASQPDAFDGAEIAPGTPAVQVAGGILLLYNTAAPTTPAAPANRAPAGLITGSRAVGEALFDAAAPGKLLGRLPRPILQAELPYETTSLRAPGGGASGAGNVTAGGLVSFQGRMLLYYGAGTGRAAVAVFDPKNPAVNPRAARKPRRPAEPDLLTPDGDGCALVRGGWEMTDAPSLGSLAPERISAPGVDTRDWFDALVPGTVLSTLVEQGVEPDPLHGDNNLRIPERYCRQAYWYRRVFTLPPALKGRRLTLGFEGINYAAEVWLNGRRLGRIDGAFVRGRLDVSDAVLFDNSAKNVLAVKILPPAHPGVPFEQSLAEGAGPNGGATMADGPSFGCSVGWDWIPGIRDRCMGLWQDVTIRAGGPVQLGDPRVVTSVPRRDHADVEIGVEVSNPGSSPQAGFVRGRLDDIAFEQPVSLEAHGKRTLTFSPTTDPRLGMDNPRLWWPNGSGGNPDLHDLSLTFVGADGAVSDVRRLKVGLREMSYEYGRDSAMELIVKVNGQRIFCRGGNWGMDDAMKRLEPESLDARVRLHRDAHLNMIRNWVGQSTGEEFYQLCDRYGILVWNDFWLANPSDGPEPADLELFLTNARDTVSRFRNHACIAFWCARNESVPPGALSSRLSAAVSALDRTRLFIPDSASFGVSGHGPYATMAPAFYFQMARGQKSELGLMSVPTADAMRAMLDERDRWPINDTWAYHDFCRLGAQKADTYLDYLGRRYGAARGLDDLCRKAQWVNYESHRAAYEAWGQQMWRGAAGLLLWMTNCSWPSTTWQLYSHDLEPTGALFGAQKACEPVHIQADPRDGAVTVVNTTGAALPRVTAKAVACDLQGALSAPQSSVADLEADAVRDCFKLAAPDPAKGKVRFVELTLTGADGALLSRNFYWLAARPDDLRELDKLAPVELEAAAEMARLPTGGSVITVRLRNRGGQVAFQPQLTLRDAASGQRVLPVFYSDNYCSLLPGGSCAVNIEFSPTAAGRALQVEIAGCNVGRVLVPVSGGGVESTSPAPSDTTK